MTVKTKIRVDYMFRLKLEMSAHEGHRLMAALKDVLELGIQKHDTRDTLNEFFRELRAAGLG